MLIMSLILGFFCVEYHKNSILAMFTPQPQKLQSVAKRVEEVAKNPEPINTNNVQLIESVERIEPVVVIKVDETEPIKPIIKKLSTKELLGEEPVKEVRAEPTPTEPIPIEPTSTPIVIKEKKENFNEIEKRMLEEMNREVATPTPTPTPTSILIATPTPTDYKPMVIEKPIVDERKIEKNNSSDLSELERLMLEEMKNFK